MSAFVLLVAVGCCPRATIAEPARAHAPLCRVFFTAEMRGNLEPCGCERGQFGGLPRRATLLAGSRRPEDLLLDLGNLAAGTTELDALARHTALQALDDLGYDAVIPGGSDLADVDDLVDAARGLRRMRIVCANLVRAASGERVFEPWFVRELSDGTRLAVVGLTSEYQRAPRGYRVEPVAEAVRDALRALRGVADRVILAGWIEGKPALELAASHPELAAVLGGKVPRGSEEILRRGGAPVMLGGESGQYVAEVELGAGAAVLGGRLRWLGADVPDDPAAAETVARWKRDLATYSDGAIRTAVATFREEGRGGSRSCAPCHAAAHEAWAASPHARSMRTLAERGEDRNATCLPCHLQDVRTTGAGLVADVEGGVGCEACHGGGARHAVVAEAEPTPRSSVARGSCVRCHDGAHSRAFEFEAYWARLAHGAATRGDEP